MSDRVKTLKWLAILAIPIAAAFQACGNKSAFNSNNSGQTTPGSNQVAGGSDANSGSGNNGEKDGSSAAGSRVATFQIAGAIDFEVARQGVAPDAQDEQFTQANQYSGFLDILLVVDNSASMSEEQNNLATKLQLLLQDPRVKAANWQIGVVTTDSTDVSFKNAATNCLRALIRKGDTNVEAAFAAAVAPGTAGDNQEKGLLTAVMGLKSECLNGKTWLRDGSALAVIIVSDEDNCSNGFDASCANQPFRNADYLTNYLSTIRKIGSEARIYGILWAPGVDVTQCITAINQGNIYGTAIKAAGGVIGSICDADYGQTLARMSTDISTIIRTQFPLKAAPPPGSVVVLMDGVAQNSGYKIQGKTLTFDNAPALGSVIKIVYLSSRIPFISKLTLPSDVIEVKQVNLNSVTMDGASWKFDSKSHILDFMTPPEQGADIRVMMVRPGTLTGRNFAVQGPINPDSVEATLEGKRISHHIIDTEACKRAEPCEIELLQPIEIGKVLTIHYSGN